MEGQTMKTNKQLIHTMAVIVLIASMLFGGAHLLTASAATELKTGDVAIIGFSFSANDFAFVLLVDIDEGTQIRFTDAGWTAAQAFFTGEGVVLYTAPQDLGAGTVISYGGSLDDFTFTTSINLNDPGDQLFAFQGSFENPTFLYGLNNNSSGWVASPQNALTTTLPPQLTDGYTAISFDNTYTNGVYIGPLTGTQEELLAAISDPANWVYTDDPVTMPSTTFYVDPGPPSVDATIPTSDAVNVLRDSQISIQFNKDVIATGDWYEIDCSESGLKIATVGGGTQDYILQLDEPFVLDDVCTVTVWAVSITDTEDPPVSMQANYVWSFNVLESDELNVGFESNSPIVSGESALFTNTTTGELPITYEWDFGDGGTSTEVNPVHNYAAVGTYPVTLTATNSYGEDSVTHDFIVLPEPLLASFTSNSPVVLGHTSVFTNTTSGEEPISYEWDFGDGSSISTAVNPEHIYDDPGIYEVTLTATNTYETDSFSATHIVLIAPGITLEKSVEPEEDVPLGGIVTYTITLENIGQGTASGVELSDTLPVEVSFGEQISGPNLTVDGNNLSWMGTINGQSSFSFVFSAVVDDDQTLYDDLIINRAYVTSTNAGEDDDSASFRVTSVPLVASFTSNSPVVLGLTSIFTNTTTGHQPITYQWDFGDGSGTSTAVSPVHVYDEAGIYEVTLTATSGTETSTFTDTHVVLNPAEVTVEKFVSPGENLPLGGEVTFTIRLANSGQVLAEGVTLEDLLPAGLVIVELVGDSPGDVDQVANSLSWSGDIPAQGEVVVVFTAYVADDPDLFGTEIENVATFTSLNAGEGQASARITIRNMPSIYFPLIMVH
jgi:uncharacterized repeat protein (TIGR01451 family)